MNVNLASIHLADATRYLARASGRQAERADADGWEVGDAIDAITRACSELGLDVVKREQKQEAA